MAQQEALPVLHPVTDYEKIKRVGEGTYGVVCKLAGACFEVTCPNFGCRKRTCTCCRQGKTPQNWRDCCPQKAQNGQGKGWCELMINAVNHDLSHFLQYNIRCDAGTTSLNCTGMPVTSVRELRVLQQCQHPNLVQLKKVVTGSKLDR